MHTLRKPSRQDGQLMIDLHVPRPRQIGQARRMANGDDQESAEIGGRIARAREAKKWSQGELSRQAGIRPETVSRYEAGLNVPRTKEAIAMARALGVAVEWLLTGEEARIVYDSDVDPAVLERVVADAGLTADQAARLRGARWSRGTSEATLRSYAMDLMREDRTVADRPRADVVLDVVGDLEKRRR
jgi:transcriptional regulator with XRE-family HTH domain